MSDTGVEMRRGRLAICGAALLAAGAAGGAVAGHAMRPAIEMAPVQPVAIRTLPGRDGIVSVRARVAEVYGGKAVLDDGSARTLAEFGPEAERERIVADGQVVLVQGRFDHGVLHASFLVDATGTVHAFGPAGGPPHPHGPGHDGPGHDGPPAPAPLAPPPPPPAG